MAINFPNSPSNGATHTAAGQTFTYDGTAGVWNPQEGTPVSTGTSAPSSPAPGDLWFDTASGTLYFYYADGSSNQWVGVSGPAGSDGAAGAAATPTSYTNLAGFPSTGNTLGDLAIAQDTKALYMWDGTEWDRVALGNDESPVITTEPPTTTQELNSDGTTSTVTMVAQDPEGFDITYGIAYKTASNARPSQLSADTTINQSTGVYTFTPTTTSSNAGTFKARLSASDGARITTRFVDFELQFYDFTISPAINGVSEWTFADDGDLILPTGAEYTITPGTNFTKTTKIWAGAGAPKSAGSAGWGQGAAGGAAVGDIAFAAGTSYVLRIGGKGGNTSGSAPSTAWGAGNSGGTYSSGVAGSGGGYTGIFSGSVAHGNAILMAGGGGGGGSSRGDGLGGRGGYAGGGTEGRTASGFVAGAGTQTAGGSGAGGGSRTSGGALSGGNGASGGGGGGGGYYGGGGGGSQGDGGYGGGGASGYYDSNTVSNATLYQGTNYTGAGNASDSDRPTNAGAGANTGSTWYDGAIVIKA
tara:strand:- start:44 stop:1627 length:1584 start_codon:yes stop_codon:yes gene_type:complete